MAELKGPLLNLLKYRSTVADQVVIRAVQKHLPRYKLKDVKNSINLLLQSNLVLLHISVRLVGGILNLESGSVLEEAFISFI